MMHHRTHIRLAFNTLSALVALALVLGVGLSGSALAQDGPPDPDSFPERRPAPSPAERSPEAATAILPATAQQLALAMGVPASDLVAADLMGSDPMGVGMSDASLGTWFPTEGSTFSILSTGLAADASLPDSSGSHSTILGGLDNNQGQDLVRLHLQLNVPDYANCASIDFAFYSEEFPEFVGSTFNDTFTAQLNEAAISVDTQTNQVIAPGNFAFDLQGNVISVNTVFGVSAGTGTTYDGVTPLLRASTAVVPDSTIDIYLSIQDLGDSIYDSAVFLDKFFWSTDPTCEGGAAADTDGDGLLDNWETDGLTVNVGGTPVFVDLPSMGADPQHKDIFVEIDYMEDGGHSHAPDPTAIQMVVDAFDNAPVSNPDGTTGIHLHVDYGPGAPLAWGAASTWGSLSDGDVLTHVEDLGTSSSGSYDWTAFDAIKATNFSNARAAVFHYNIWAHDLAAAFGSTSGISRNGSGADFGSGASDFIVSLGSWTGQTGTVNQQAGTFMHELGHNLGLRHGGEDHTQWKPNYLSVMNYAFQTRGLIIGGTQGHFDYSRYDLANLNENSLNESAGINVPGAITDTLGTRYYCGLGNQVVDLDASSADWNCDGDTTDVGINRNINEGESWNNNATLDVLTSQNDWLNLVYSGGAIGAPGAIIDLPQLTEVIDIDESEDSDLPPTTNEVDVWVDVPATLDAPPAGIGAVTVLYSNYGQTLATSVTVTATLGGGLTYLGDSAGVTPTVSGNQVVWELPDLDLTDSGWFLMQVELPNDPFGTTYSVDLEITSDGPEADPADNTASADLMAAYLNYLPTFVR